MVYTPDSQTEKYEQLRDQLRYKTPELTNFNEQSLNYVLLHDGWAAHWAVVDHAILAVQLSGWIDYAGGPVEDEHLSDLGLEERWRDGYLDLDLLNSFMSDSDLDSLAATQGVTRDAGRTAVGEVLLTVGSDTDTVRAGTVVGTTPDEDGEYLAFETTEAATPADDVQTILDDDGVPVEVGGGVTTLAPIEAVATGAEYNVPSGRITYVPDQPAAGVITDVTNPTSTTAGEDEETNDELRTRAKSVTSQQVGGGTVDGIKGFIIDNVDGVQEGGVVIDENFNPTGRSPYADVIVDGGTDAAVQAAIDASHSSAHEHLLVRPRTVSVDVTAQLSGGAIDTAIVADVIVQYLAGLGLGGDLYDDRLVQRILNADNDIENIDTLRLDVHDEPHDYIATDDTYELNTPRESSTPVAIHGTAGGVAHTFVEGTDYVMEGGTVIRWQPAGAGVTRPDDGTAFYADYQVRRDNDVPVELRERIAPGVIAVTLTV